MGAVRACGAVGGAGRGRADLVGLRQLLELAPDVVGRRGVEAEDVEVVAVERTQVGEELDAVLLDGGLPREEEEARQRGGGARREGDLHLLQVDHNHAPVSILLIDGDNEEFAVQYVIPKFFGVVPTIHIRCAKLCVEKSVEKERQVHNLQIPCGGSFHSLRMEGGHPLKGDTHMIAYTLTVVVTFLSFTIL